MKKLLVLVLALAAVIGMIFAVNVTAADATKLTGLADVSKFYKADNSEVAGGGMNGGSYMSHLFDGSYGACYNNNVGSYIVTDLNAKLAGGYYVTEIKIFHSNDSKFSLYYTSDGVTWKPIVEKTQTTEGTYAVGDIAIQVKYVFDTCANWVASAKEIEIYGINPAELACTHGNIKADGWTPIPGSATCTGVGKVSQACPDCGEVLEQVSNDVLPLGHDLVTTITRPGTSVSYGAATLNCSRCEYTIDFSGEVNLTDMDKYCSIGESQQFTNVLVSSIADLWGASTVENMFKGDWNEIGPFWTWVAAGEVDDDEYVILDFQGVIDLTKIKVLVQNDSGGTLVISALNEETGEYEVVRSLQSYDANIGGGQALVMEVPMLGVTTSSIKIQAFSNWRNTNGYYYNRMVIGELEAYGIAEGCGLDADNHECSYDIFVEFNTAPTCQQNGTATYKCACNATTVVEVAASEEYHNYIEVEGTRVDSTCTEAGSYTGKCEYCEVEATIDLEIDLENGHSYVETGRTDADCVNAGSIEYACEKCDATKTEEIAALGHKYGEAVVVPSTCKDNGTSTKTCTVCGNEDVTTLETTGCTWTLDSIITEPTCGAAGEANYICSVCGETKVDSVAATGNHVWDTENVNVTLAPSCTTTGAGDYTCTVCAKVEKLVIPALGHDWQDATCNAPKTCLRCGVANGSALEHEWDEGWVWPWPSCEANGVCTYTCNLCYTTRVEEVEADLDNIEHHSCSLEWETRVAPSCKADGYEKYICDLCGKVFEEITPASEEYHSWETNMETYVDATCAVDGYAEKTCTICGAYKEEVLEKEFYGMHNYVCNTETFVQATCSVDGYAEYTCSVCGNTYVEETPASPSKHDYVGSNNNILLTCTECGAFTFSGEMTAVDNSYSAMFAWEGTAFNIYYGEEFDIYYNIEVISVVDGVYTLALTTWDEDVLSIVGGTAVLTLVENGGTMVITAADGTVYTFESFAPDYNKLINGVYATADGSVKVQFADGVATVLVNEAGAPLPETFNYNYNPMIGMIDCEGVYMNVSYSIDEDAIYFGMMPLFKTTDDVEPEEPVNYGDYLETIVVETTDTYGYLDLYSYTAKKAGQYSFFVPSGLGFYTKAMHDTYAPAEVDFYENYNGEYVVINLAAGETVEFYIASTIKSEWEIEVYFYTDEVHVHTEEIIPAVPGELRNPGKTSGVKCSECGEILVAPVTADANFRFAAVNLSLGESVAITYKAQVPAGFTNVYVVFDFNGEKIVVEDYQIESSTGRYVFTFKGTRLQSMADLVTATVYAEQDGIVSANSYSNYSVKTYIVNQLNKDSSTAKLKTMLSDLLVLGAKTQVYMNYKANDLMTADVMDILTPSTYAGVPSSEYVQQMIVNDESSRSLADWKAVSLTFSDAMAIEFKLAIDASVLNDIEIRVTLPGTNVADEVVVYTAEDLTYDAASNRYVLLVENIKALQYGKTIVGDLYLNNVKISRTVNYSVNTYIQKNQDNANVALREFLRAAYLYGEAVCAYNGK